MPSGVNLGNSGLPATPVFQSFLFPFFLFPRDALPFPFRSSPVVTAFLYLFVCFVFFFFFFFLFFFFPFLPYSPLGSFGTLARSFAERGGVARGDVSCFLLWFFGSTRSPDVFLTVGGCAS